MKKRERLLDVDRAKGLAIFFVVYGHLISDNFPKGNSWYEISYEMIYRFHMPFFMFLSGLTLFFTYKKPHNINDYLNYCIKKTTRIAPAFFFFALIIFTGKTLAANFLHVDNIPGNLANELFLILVTPGQSSAGSLWYIYVLLELMLIFPLLLIPAKGNPTKILPFALILYFIESTPYFLIENIFEYLFFFTLGASAIYHRNNYTHIVDKYRWALVSLFLLSFFTMTIADKSTSKLFIGLCSIPALHSLVRHPIVAKANFLVVLGLMSFPIYLINTISIGLARGITLKFFDWNGTNFLVVAPILLFAGLYLPIFIKRHIFKFIPPLDRITN